MNFSLPRQSLLAPVSTILVMMMLAIASANAADAPIPYGAPPPQYAPPPPAPPPYTPPPYAAPLPVPQVPCLWLGPYVGANLGFQWTSSISGLNSSGFTGMSGVTGGIQGGYNWLNGPWVYGVESDFNLSSASGTFAGYQFADPWFGTVRGRAGYAINNVFLYGTAGVAFGVSTVSIGGMSDTSMHMGWTIGAGAEFGLASWGLGPNYSVKVEYLYLGLSQGTELPVSVPSNSNVLRLGVNYHF
jgi:outer membrane immunogenic protein